MASLPTYPLTTIHRSALAVRAKDLAIQLQYDHKAAEAMSLGFASYMGDCADLFEAQQFRELVRGLCAENLTVPVPDGADVEALCLEVGSRPLPVAEEPIPLTITEVAEDEQMVRSTGFSLSDIPLDCYQGDEFFPARGMAYGLLGGTAIWVGIAVAFFHHLGAR